MIKSTFVFRSLDRMFGTSLKYAPLIPFMFVSVVPFLQHMDQSLLRGFCFVLTPHIGFRVDGNETINCMHGSTECLGNMLCLCAISLFPKNPVVSLGFSNCLILSYPQIPNRDLVESCALEHGIEFGELNSCISEEGKGMELLESSIERSQHAGVRKSCTIRVREKIWCVRDGGKWVDCEHGNTVDDLVNAVLHGHD